MTLNCIIVDDDELSQLTLRKCVEQVKFLNLVAVCNDALEATEVLANNSIDLVFLDIEMPNMSGIDLVKNFEVPQIIFVTSKAEFAPEAFDLDVTDFIIKPVELPRFLKACDRALQNAQSRRSDDGEGSEYVFVKHDSRYIKIKMEEIHYVEALADYVNIYLETSRHTILSTMKAIESKLPEKEFVRVHRSYIVRIDKIQEIEDNTIILQGNKLIPVSRSYKENLMNHLRML
ncbi:MAG: LytTR family DNA-binding domain-containing protein [Bacteroidota bacterium]